MVIGVVLTWQHTCSPKYYLQQLQDIIHIHTALRMQPAEEVLWAELFYRTIFLYNSELLCEFHSNPGNVYHLLEGLRGKVDKFPDFFWQPEVSIQKTLFSPSEVFLWWVC